MNKQVGKAFLIVSVFVMAACSGNPEVGVDAIDTDIADLQDVADVHVVADVSGDATDTAASDVPASDASDAADATPQDIFTPDLPPSFPPRPTGMPFTIERPEQGPPPDADDIQAFTDSYAEFLKKSDFLKWVSRHSQGFPENNEWDLPGYKVWWMSAHLIKQDGLVTLTFERPPDNHLATVGRALGPLTGLFLASGDETARELALGLMKGVSATYEGMIWGNEDPVIDSIMARAIFNRDYQTDLDGGRRIAVDYTSVRYSEVVLRHDTVHNPANPTWGDLYVRNKRSKDDFPLLYRSMAMLVSLAWGTRDDAARDIAVKLFGQVRAMAADIVDNQYCIRTKDADGKPYIPLMESGSVEDFATYTAYESFCSTAECTAKLATAYLASGTAMGNVCEDEYTLFYGHGGIYEDGMIARHYVGTVQVWGNHIAALAVALTFGDFEIARKLLDGMVIRMDGLVKDERAAQYPEWLPDVAQLLILCAAYGMPLTGDEARLIQTHFLSAAGFYQDSVVWDPWDESVPEDTICPVIPDRLEYDDQGAVIRAHVMIEDMLTPFEYCSSAFRAKSGAAFVDCERLLAQSGW